jgi:hypothetical protein
MHTYARKPLSVEAWRNDDAGPVMPVWLERITTRGLGGVINFKVQVTGEGDEFGLCQLGDWIVLRADGTIAVMDPETFARDFDPADAGPPASRVG